MDFIYVNLKEHISAFMGWMLWDVMGYIRLDGMEWKGSGLDWIGLDWMRWKGKDWMGEIGCDVM